MNRDKYTEANRVTWNETAGIHADVQLQGLLQNFRDPEFTTLDAIEKGIFARLGVEGKAVAQLSCNNGRELLSVKRLGAGRCVGFDISDAFIAQGRKLARSGQIEAEFVCSDVYRIPQTYDGNFDIIYVTIGALGWLPDLDGYFSVVARLLKPGGALFIYEMHPLLDMFEAETGLEVAHSYFRTEPFESSDDPDYYDPSQRIASTSYWFHHKLSDVIGGCLQKGLSILFFEEYEHDISMVYKAFEALEHKPPLCYSLVARKSAAGVRV